MFLQSENKICNKDKILIYLESLQFYFLNYRMIKTKG